MNITIFKFYDIESFMCLNCFLIMDYANNL